jgi:hypothetical protein
MMAPAIIIAIGMGTTAPKRQESPEENLGAFGSHLEGSVLQDRMHEGLGTKAEAPNVSIYEITNDPTVTSVPVEAIDQLAADRLHVFMRINGAESSTIRGIHYWNSLGLVVGEAIFGLPEQARHKAEAVFVS